MADDVAKTALIIDASGAKKGADDFAAAGQNVIAVEQQVQQAEEKTAAAAEQSARRKTTARKAAAAAGSEAARAEIAAAAGAADVFAKSTERVVTSLTSQARFLNQAARAYDPLAAAAQKAQGDINRLNGIVASGGENAARASSLLAGAQERLATVQRAASIASNDNTRSTAAAVISTGQMRFAVQNLSFQLNDIATSLASGGSPFRVLAQQGGQFVQVFQQGGGPSAVLGAFGRTIAGLVTPTTVAIGLAAVLAGGVVFLGSRAADNEQQLRVFDSTLRRMGTSSLATAGDLQQVVRSLRDTGTATADAIAAAHAFARTPGLNPAAASSILPLARDTAAFRGEDFASVAQRMTTAFATSTEATIRLVYELAGPNGLTVAEAASMRTMSEHGNRAGAVAVAIEALQRKFAGFHKDALSPGQEAIDRLTGAWSRFLDRLTDTGPIKGAIDKLTELLDRVGKGLSGDFTLPSAPTGPMEGGAIGRTVDRAYFAARRAVVGTARAAWDALPDLGDPLANQREFADAQARRAAADGGVGMLRGLLRAERQGGIPLGSTEAVAANQGLTGTAAALLAGYGLGGFAQPAAPARDRFQGVSPDLREGLMGGPNAVSNAVSAQALADLDKAEEARARYNKAIRQTGQDLIYAKTYEEAFAASGREGAERVWEAELKAEDAVKQHRIELGKAADTQTIANDLALKGAEALTGPGGEVAGLQAAAMARAVLAQRAGDAIDVQSKYNELLRTGAVEAIDAAAKALPGLVQQTAATQRLADAAKVGSAAEHEAGLQNQATAATHNVVTAALATGDKALISRAEKLRELTLAQIKANDAESQSLRIRQDINSRNDQIEVLRLQAGLQGQAPEAIAAAIARLQEEIRLRNLGESVSKETAAADLASVDALSRANAQLAEATRNSQRLDDGIRSVASTVENTLTRSIEDAFSGRKVDDWGTRIKAMLGSLAAQISDALFIKPLLGSIIGALGFGSAAQSFGSFGGLGGLFGGGSSSGGLTVTQTGPNTFSLSNLSNAASLGKSLFGESSPGLLPDWLGGGNGGLFGNGGFSGFLNNIGGSLGFAQPGAGLSGIGSPFSSTLFGPGNPAATGSLFGSTTFGSFLGGAGAGFGAGTLLNSLLGGNQLTGSIGSGLGSLAGAAIGSIIPGIGTLIGGLIGGAGGGLLGGLFGNTHKPSNAAGGLVDLASGAVSAYSQTGGVNDQASRQFIDTLAKFTVSIRQLTGGTLEGSLNPQVYTSQGGKPVYKVGYRGVGTFGTGDISFNDAQTAVSTIELGIVKSLTNISATMKQIFGSVTDPSQLQDAVQFAAIYDNLKKAADSAFASIATDTQKIGPFKTALDQITATFADITTKAQQYGLSLDPVTKGLAEAKRRLIADENKAFADAILAITDPARLAVDQAKAAGKALLDDAIATGASRVQAERLNALTLDGIWKSQTQSLLQLKAELTGGALSGLTGAQAVTAANDNFRRTLALVKGGSLSEIGNLATAGQSAIQQAVAAYGNAPQTAALRASVLAAVDSVLASRSFAGGTGSTPPGWVRYGERGPEWVHQGGGATVLPFPSAPAGGAGYAELIAEVRALRSQVAALLEGGNKIAQEVGVTAIGRLDRVAAGIERGNNPVMLPPRRAVGA